MKKQSKEDLSIFPRVALIELIDYMQKALEYKQDIIDKAIEYIEANMEEEYIHTDYIYTMIKILRGEDNGTMD